MCFGGFRAAIGRVDTCGEFAFCVNSDRGQEYRLNMTEIMKRSAGS